MSLKMHFGKLFALIFAVIIGFPIFSSRPISAASAYDTGVLASMFGFGSKSKSPAVDFELPDLNGSVVRLSKFKGDRPVLLYFWATWCPYCITVRPEVTKLREKTGPAEMEILAINVGGQDSIERLKRYQEGHPVSWPILYDTEGKVTRAYKVQGIPIFVLIDKDGNVVYRDTDPPSDVRKYLH